MNFILSTSIAFEAIRANLFRSILTSLGVFIGVASVIVMLAFGNGAEKQVAERIRAMGSNLLMVRPGALSSHGVRSEAGSSDTLTEEDAVAIAREVPGVLVSAPSVAGTGQIVRGNLNWNTLVGGVTPDYLAARDWQVERGRPLSQQDQDQVAKVILLGATVAERLFGQGEPVGQSVRIGTVPFVVVGVLRPKGGSAIGRDQDDAALVPLSTAKIRLLGARSQIRRSAVDYVLVKVAAAEMIPQAQVAIQQLLRTRHGLAEGAEDDFSAEEPSSAMEVQAAAKRSLTLLLAAVASVSVVVGGVSIMNIMLVSVTERTREIGLRQALGARRSEVRSQFLVEAVMLCVIGGLAGVGAGVAIAAFVAEWAGWPIAISPASVAFSLGFAAVVGLFFGYYPASKASSLDPIEALRIE